MQVVELTGGITPLARALRAALDGSGPAVLPLAEGASPAAMRPDLPVEPGTALIVQTSGSTGTPKGVLLSAPALRASAGATHTRLGGPGHWLLAMPAHHVAGVQVLVRSLVAGTPLGVVPPGAFRGHTFVESASSVLSASGPRYTALVPTQLTRLLAEGGEGLAALRSFDGVLVGGAATPAPLLERALAAGVRVRTTYGMSETAGGCVYDGRPLDGVRVSVVDGLIRLGGPTLASGYRLDPGAPAFEDGWFRTNDAGEFVDGLLSVSGRADDVINTGGEKVVPAVVERALLGCPGVEEACVVGVPDAEWGERVVAAVVGRVAGGEVVEWVRGVLGGVLAPKEVVVVAELPLRGPGKVDRRAVAGLFGGGRA
ncbi:o-succinylbenzoate--CoA ligase [Actinokineospora pegani]|uniref:o-succinylbenzoate--CoA ligase n=1 Tax=Actinokineospora pegani TaxID=2654637 RepID=UPI0012E9B008|nr:o-succinylbenzoate--CoA ligase [Actinokineospora pegani]